MKRKLIDLLILFRRSRSISGKLSRRPAVNEADIANLCA